MNRSALQPANDLAISPFVANDRRGARMVERLHAEPVGFSLSQLVAIFVVSGVFGFGLGSAIWGALQFALWGLSLFGRGA
jgi:hypothetical protein